MSTIAVILPAYNEELTIVETIEQFHKYVKEQYTDHKFNVKLEQEKDDFCEYEVWKTGNPIQSIICEKAKPLY